MRTVVCGGVRVMVRYRKYLFRVFGLGLTLTNGGC